MSFKKSRRKILLCRFWVLKRVARCQLLRLFNDGSDNTALLSWFLLKIRSVRILDTIVCSESLFWLFSPAWDAVKLTLPGCWLHLSIRGHWHYRFRSNDGSCSELAPGLMFDNFLPIPDAESLPFYPLVVKLVVCCIKNRLGMGQQFSRTIQNWERKDTSDLKWELWIVHALQLFRIKCNHMFDFFFIPESDWLSFASKFYAVQYCFAWLGIYAACRILQTEITGLILKQSRQFCPSWKEKNTALWKLRLALLHFNI